MQPNSESPHDAEPIRVALVITELLPGGAERCLTELATHLDRARFAPVVYSLGRCPPADRQIFVSRLREAQVPTHFLDLDAPWQYFRGVRRLAELFRQQQPNIVQTFLFHANVLGVRAARLAGVGRVATSIRVADPRRWRNLLERWATSSADRHVCVSAGVQEHCRRHGFASEKLLVIPNGIDVDRWSDVPPAKLETFGVPSGKRVFVFVGRLDVQKGLDLFFQQLPEIFAAAPGHDFLLIGEGKERGRLQSLANELGVLPRVHFAGWQPAIAPILAASDLLVLPSRWEGMPNVILEAMAAGKPIVAFQVHGVQELLGDSAGSQVVSPERPSQFASHVCEMLSKSILDNDLGDKNRDRVRQKFSLAMMIKAFEQHFLSLAGGPG